MQQLSKLAEEEGDLETAARYQKMHEELAASDDGQARLAILLAKAGDLEEAQAVWSKAAAGKSQSFRVFQAMDNLLSNGKPLPVLEITEASLRATRQTGRHSTARGWRSNSSAGRRRPWHGSQSSSICTVGDDEMSAFAKAQARNPRLQASGAPKAAIAAARNAVMPLEEPRRHVVCDPPFLQALAHRLLPRGYSWSPADFGQARMAALGWLVSLADHEQPSRLDEVARAVFARRRSKTPTDLHAVWNWFYLCVMREDNAGAFEAGQTKLSEAAPNDPLALWAYLHALGARNTPAGQRYRRRGLRSRQAGKRTSRPSRSTKSIT